MHFIKFYLYYYLLFCILNLKNQVHSIEIYQYNTNSIYSIISNVNIILKSTLKRIHSLYNLFFNIKEDYSYIEKYIEEIYKKIILLKNKNISLNKKIIMLVELIKENMPTENDQKIILRIYKKILSIIL